MKKMTTQLSENIIFAIRFGDNDYHGTFKVLLKTIALAQREGAYRKNELFLDKPGNKEKALELINNLVYPIYKISQCDKELSQKEEEFMKNYLQTNIKYFLFGAEELDAYTSKGMDNNYSTFVLDTRLPKEQEYYCF